jgi:uncharacterized membrane protein YjjB (DUF3815 family)
MKILIILSMLFVVVCYAKPSSAKDCSFIGCIMDKQAVETLLKGKKS